MRPDRLADLLRIAQEKPRPSASPPATGSPLESGQIRRLDQEELSEDSALVLVLRVDPDAHTAHVALAISPTDLASNRDPVVGAADSGAPFAVAILADAVATVWTHQLLTGPAVGTVPRSALRLARRASRLSTDRLAAEANEAGVALGQTVVEPGDQAWWMRARATQRLARLGESCNEGRFTPAVADPGILEAALTRGSADDLHAVSLLTLLLEQGAVEVTPAAWEVLGEESLGGRLSPDLARMVGGVLLERLLTATGPATAHDPVSRPDLVRAVTTPADDPFDTVVATRAAQGHRTSRIYTSPHLWAKTTAAAQVQVAGRAHTVVVETEASLMPEHSPTDWSTP